MKPEAHTLVVPAQVRKHRLYRHAAKSFNGGTVFATACGFGWPRLWHFAATHALTGFGLGLDGSSGSRETEFVSAFASAKDTLTRQGLSLIESDLPDASLIAVGVDGDHMQILSAGEGRVYLQRVGQSAERLTSRDETHGGILTEDAIHVAAVVAPGDLLLIGSESAFSRKSIDAIAATLEATPQSATAVLAGILADPAAQSGAGGVATVLRVR